MEKKAADDDIVESVLREQKGASVKPLVYCSSVILLTAISVGFEMAFTIVGQELFYNQDGGTTPSSIQMTEEEVSWFVSIINIGMMPGSLLAGPVSDSFGCKWTLRLASSLILSGHAVVLAANQAWHIFLARALQGLGSGLCLPTCLTLLSEISTVRLRASLIMSKVTTNNFSCLLGLVVGKLFLDDDVPLGLDSLSGIVLCFAAPPLAFLLLSTTLPESPVHSAKRGDKEETVKALRFLRGLNCSIDAEIKELLICTHKDAHKSTPPSQVARQDSWRHSNPYFSLRFLKPLALMVTLMALVAFSGIDAVFYYCLQLFHGRDMVLQPYAISICCQVGITIGYSSVAVLINRLPRRLLASVGAVVMAASLTILGAVLSYDDHRQDELGVERDFLSLLAYYLPPVAMVTFTLGYGGGVGCVIWTLSSEIFPPRVKSLGCSVSVVVRFVIVFVLLKVYPHLMHQMSPPVVIAVHGVFTFLAAVFIVAFMPETKGLTTYQISHLYDKRRMFIDEEGSGLAAATATTDATSEAADEDDDEDVTATLSSSLSDEEKGEGDSLDAAGILSV